MLGPGVSQATKFTNKIEIIALIRSIKCIAHNRETLLVPSYGAPGLICISFFQMHQPSYSKLLVELFMVANKPFARWGRQGISQLSYAKVLPALLIG